jgi:hypothetical protein
VGSGTPPGNPEDGPGNEGFTAIRVCGHGLLGRNSCIRCAKARTFILWMLKRKYGAGGEDLTPTKTKKQAVSGQSRAEDVPL